MRLYLVQHGRAKSKEEDPERGLTEDGIAEVQKVARLFSASDAQIHVIWQSGKKRAKETADIIGETLGIPNRIMEHTKLAPNDPPFEIEKEIAASHHDLMIVGHLPFLAKLAGRLLAGDEDRRPVSFRNSGIVCLEKGDTGWSLVWAITPEVAGP